MYYNEWVSFNDDLYYFNANGYIVKDIYKIRGGWYVFDRQTGMFLVDYAGIYTAANGDIYYIENGQAVRNKGLVRVINADGEANYYYFGCHETSNYCPTGNQCNEFLAQKNGVHWVENNNNLLVKWDYTFGADGVIDYDAEYAKCSEPNHKVVTYDGVMYYTIDGIKVHMGLFCDENGKYYYARSSGALVTGRPYYVTDTNGLLPADSYLFGEDGAIIMEPTFYTNSGVTYYYENGVLTYAGLIEMDGNYYYVRSNGQLVKDRIYWITKTNGLKVEKAYNFDETGKLVEENRKEDNTTGGIVEVSGVLYYYKDGIPYYAGLIEVDGKYYYVNSGGKVITGQTYWITKTNDLMAEGAYSFDENGVLIIE